jgi:hypothetical protein
MKSTSLLPETKKYSSLSPHSSETMPGVQFVVKRASLGQRIDLNHRVRELTMKYDFLKAGDATSQLEAALSELLVMRLYLEWGLERVEGLLIDEREATIASLITNGPERLAHEIVGVIQAENNLTDDERKNF